MNYIKVYPLQISQTMSEGSSYILILRADDPRKEVPILIGETEAQAIVMAVEGKQAKRPLTHNLLANLMEQYMLSLQQVTIDSFEEGIFYATLHVTDGFTEKKIDSRTSDAVALALLMGADIFIHPTVFGETCMEPGALIDNLPHGRSADTATIEALEALLRECEENEDYERAQEISDQIEKLKSDS